MNHLDDENGKDIAVIGMGCRFPAAPNVEAFWKMLTENT
ncbi:hypothetical protein GO002_04405, partial [Streptomyces eurocidicus]|nr:hypothetical protein [Streptomyces eurocidicus]